MYVKYVLWNIKLITKQSNDVLSSHQGTATHHHYATAQHSALSSINVQCSVASTLSGISAHCFLTASSHVPSCLLPSSAIFTQPLVIWLTLAEFELQPNFDVSPLPTPLISAPCLCPLPLHRPFPLPSLPSSLLPPLYTTLVAHTPFITHYCAPLPYPGHGWLQWRVQQLSFCHIDMHLPHDFLPVTACWQTPEEINNIGKVSHHSFPPPQLL